MEGVVLANDSLVRVRSDNEKVTVTVVDSPITVVLGQSGPQGPRGTQVLSGPTPPQPTDGILGDQYLDTTTGMLYGPKTELGWGAGVNLVATNPTDLAYIHDQQVPSTVWTINHNLNFNPNVSIVDSAGTVVEGDCQYINSGTIVITLSAAMAGKAYLS